MASDSRPFPTILTMSGASGSADGTRAADAFVGRGSELARLTRCLEESLGGHPRVVLLSGEAGIGKTRLVEQFAALAAARSVWRCRGRAYEGLRLPYQLFVEILQDQLADVPEAVERVLGDDAARITALVRADETLAEARLADTGVEHHPSRMGLFVAVSRATIELARVRPTLLLLEDLHWADEASLQQLSHLVFAVGEASLRAPVPLLIVATQRPAEPQSCRRRGRVSSASPWSC